MYYFSEFCYNFYDTNAYCDHLDFIESDVKSRNKKRES